MPYTCNTYFMMVHSVSCPTSNLMRPATPQRIPPSLTDGRMWPTDLHPTRTPTLLLSGNSLFSCNINICNLSLKPIQWTPDCWWWNHVKSQLWIVKSYCFSLGPIFYPFHTTSLLPVVQALRERHLWMRRWNADGMPLPLSAVPAFSLGTGHPLGRPCISGRRPGTWVQLGGKEPYGQKNKIYCIKISSATCPLFRCKSARTTNFSSCGIGLSLCNSIYVPHLPSPATANLLALRLPGSVCLAATVPQHSMFQNISGHTMGSQKNDNKYNKYAQGSDLASAFTSILWKHDCMFGLEHWYPVSLSAPWRKRTAEMFYVSPLL